jgi:hypothetical protein
MAFTPYSSLVLARVQMLVRERPATILIKDLARDVQVSPKWLGDFANGKFDNPSIKVLERLHLRLTGKPMQLVDHV